ncbi:MAG: DUF6531 domain-containing protein, partial [Acidimicrobiales bacterium]
MGEGSFIDDHQQSVWVRRSIPVLAASLIAALLPTVAMAQGVCAGDELVMRVGQTVVYNGFSLVNGSENTLEDRYLEVFPENGVRAEVVDPDSDNIRQSQRFDLSPGANLTIPVRLSALRVGEFAVRAEQKEDNRFRPDPTDRELCVVVKASTTTTTTTTTTGPTTTLPATTGTTTPGSTVPGTTGTTVPGTTVPGTGSTTPGTTGTTVPGTGSTTPGTTGTTTPVTTATTTPPTRPPVESPRGAVARIDSPAVASTSDPVQVSTGNFHENLVDLGFGGEVFGLDLLRSYNSTSTVDEVVRSRTHPSFLGRGWQLGFQVTAIERADRSVAVTLPMGTVAVFLPSNGGYERPADFPGQLVDGPSNFQLHMFNGDRLSFDNRGRMVSVESPIGETIDVVFGDIGQIERVVSSVGLSIDFDYDDDRRIIAARSMFEGVVDRTVGYGYDADGDLSSFTDADGATTRYETDESGRILAITDPTGITTVSNDFDDRARATSQTAATGESSTFDYTDGLTRVDIVADDGRSIRTDTFRYRSDDQGYTVEIVDPAGGTVSHQRNGAGNAITSTTRGQSADGGDGTVRTFDEFGNVLTETVPGVGQWRYEYSYSHQFGDGVRPLHRLTKIVAPNGGTSTYSYDSPSSVPSRIDGPAGGGVTNTIVDGLVTESGDIDGVRTSYGYDEQRRLSSVTDGLGNTSRMERDAAGRLVAITDPTGNATKMSYDGVGRLISVEDPTGATRVRTHDAAGRLTAFADALDEIPGITSRADFEYDSAGLLATAEDQRGNRTSFGYNGFGQTTSAVEPGGAEWTYEFAELGRMTAATNPSEPGRRTSLGYDVDGLLATVERADDSRTSADYDVAGRVTRLVDPNGIVSRFSYATDQGGQLASETYAAGTADQITVTYGYDAAYRLASISGPRPGQVRTFTYTPGGRLATATNANGHAVAYRYDGGGRVETVILPGDREIRYLYDASSRVTAVVSPTGLRYETGYDELGRVVLLRSPAGVETRFTYDRNGTVTSTQTGDDNPTTFDVDALVLNQATDANSGSAESEYDGRYNLVRWVDQEGNATKHGYDLADQLTSTADALGRTTLVAYDEVGRVAKIGDPSGRTFTSTYDDGDRLIAMTFGDGSSQSLRYDNLNRLREVSDIGRKGKTLGTATYDYDEAGNLTRVEEADGDVIGYEWDLVGNRTALIYPDGSRVSYHYDELGRMVSARHSEQGVTRYRWDDDSRLTKVTFPDGKTRRYRYTGEQLTGFADRNREWKLNYDRSGRLIEVSGHDYRSFDYDSGGQLTEAIHDRQSWTYRYDAVGNIVEVDEAKVKRPKPGKKSRDGDDDDNTGRTEAAHGRKLGPPEQAYTHDRANQLATAKVDGVRSKFRHDGAGRLTTEVKA